MYTSNIVNCVFCSLWHLSQHGGVDMVHKIPSCPDDRGCKKVLPLNALINISPIPISFSGCPEGSG